MLKVFVETETFLRRLILKYICEKTFMRMKGLSQVGMTVKDMRTSLEFYSKTLGFPIIAVKEMPSKVIEEVYGLKADTKMKIALLRTGWGSMIELFEFVPSKKRTETYWNHPSMTHIALDVGNIKKVKKRLEKDGVKFITEPIKVEGTEVVFLKDPDGHLIELIDLGAIYYVNRYIGSVVAKIITMIKYKDLDKI
jgi:lactoylglutathione lyase